MSACGCGCGSWVWVWAAGGVRGEGLHSSMLLAQLQLALKAPDLVCGEGSRAHVRAKGSQGIGRGRGGEGER